MKTIDLTFVEPTDYRQIHPIPTPEILSQQIILINNGRKSKTQLIFSPFNRLTGYNPLVKNGFYGGYSHQIFLPYSIEVVDYVLELFKNSSPTEENFVNSNWDPGFDQGDSNPNSIIGTDAIVEDTLTKLKNSKYVDFNCMYNGSFTMRFFPHYQLPTLDIFWHDEIYIPDEDWIIAGEVEVGTFYQMLKLYRKVIDSI